METRRPASRDRDAYVCGDGREERRNHEAFGPDGESAERKPVERGGLRVVGVAGCETAAVD